MEQNQSWRYSPRIIHTPSSVTAHELLGRIGVDPYGITAMIPKMFNVQILLNDVECRVANIIKQEMLSCGGDAAVHRDTVACKRPTTDVLIMGTRKQARRFAEKLSQQPFGLAELAKALDVMLDNMDMESFTLKTNRRKLALNGKTWIMGILNVTPDSFSDGGRFSCVGDAVTFGCRMVEAGADIIDIGGESSRPGAEPVSLEVELSRIMPVIEALHDRVEVPLSIDTNKAEVARQAIAAGAEIINDISAMSFDPRMPEIIAASGAAVVLMHMRGTPKTMQQDLPAYRFMPGDIIAYLRCRMDEALAQGITAEQIIIDPGFGFGKTVADNIALLRHLAEFRVLGRPILAGVSRKSFIRELSRDAAADVASAGGTAAAIAATVLHGAAIIRVHDVQTARNVTAIADAVMAENR